MRLFLFLFGVLLLFIENSYAQQTIIITGTVTDSVGMPLPGAKIVVKGSTAGIISDSEGKYSINISDRNAVLVFSTMDYEQEVSVGSRTEINITLLEPDKSVVTALGIKRQANALSYSVAEIKGGELPPTSDPNVMNTLSGKIPGVDIITYGSGIAGSSQVVIRGHSTISGDPNPIYVIDGVPINRNHITLSGRDFGDVLNTINFEDIQSINILKGGASAALYGSQAANGAVLITTKKGRQHQGIGVTYNGSFGFEEYSSPFKNRQTTYGMGVEAKKPDIAAYGWLYNAHQEWGGKYDGSPAFYPDNTPVPWGYSYYGDPWETFMDKGFFMNNLLAFAVGDEKQHIRASVFDMRKQSPIPNSDMNRQTIMLNGGFMIGKKFHVDAKVDYATMEVQNRPNTQSYVWTLGHMPTMWDIEWAKGKTSKIGAQEDEKMLPWSTNEYYQNPYWAAYQNGTNDRRNRFNGLIAGCLDITDWLFLKIRIDVEWDKIKARTVEAYGATQFSNGTGSVTEMTYKDVVWNYDYSLVLDKNFGNFHINTMFGWNTIKLNSNIKSLTGTKLTIPFWEVITNSSVKASNDEDSKTKMSSLYGSAEFSYKNLIYLTLTGRNEWLPVISSEDNSYFYYGIGMSYMFSQHLPMPVWVSLGKLRASYAKVGGMTGAQMAKSRYDLNMLGYMGYPTISLPNTLLMENLKPYKVTEWEIGTDLQFLKNRISVDYTYYHKSTDDDYVNIPTGYNNSTAKTISNKGHEIMLTIVPIKGSFTWDMTFVYAHNKSEILNLKGAQELQSASADVGGATIKQIVGQPYNAIAGYRQAIYPVSGQPIWEWNTSRGIWFPQRTAQTEILGTGIHPNIGSISTTFRFKGIDLNAMIDGKWGAKVYSYTEYDMTARGHSKRTAEYRESGIPIAGVYKDATGNYIPINHHTNISYEGNNFENYYRYAFGDLISDYNVFDASYVMMRQISLGYTLPKSISQRVFIQNIRLSIVGRNLFSIYNNLPNGDASTLSHSGIDRYILPTTRCYSFNINLAF